MKAAIIVSVVCPMSTHVAVINDSIELPAIEGSREATRPTIEAVIQKNHQVPRTGGAVSVCHASGAIDACQVSLVAPSGFIRFAKGTKNQPTLQPGVFDKPMAPR